jgi:hypothetical protein
MIDQNLLMQLPGAPITISTTAANAPLRRPVERDVHRRAVRLGQLARPIIGATTRLRRQDSGRNSGTPSRKVHRGGSARRSAITLTGIRGLDIRNQRISGSTASTINPGPTR